MELEILSYPIVKEIEEDIALNREELEIRFDERYEVLKSNIWFIKNIKNLASERSIADIATLWNVFGYLNLLSYDLISVGYNLYFERKPWQKVYFARQVSLLIYEGMMDIPDLLGKSFKDIFANISDSQLYMNQLKTYKKELEDYKSLYSEKLKEIRNSTAGHRDHNIDEQIKVIQKINPYDTIKMMTDFEKIVRKIMDHLQPLIVRTVKPMK
jgi:hypothetical protein